jgi:hypothetical protein
MHGACRLTVRWIHLSTGAGALTTAAGTTACELVIKPLRLEPLPCAKARTGKLISRQAEPDNKNRWQSDLGNMRESRCVGRYHPGITTK